MDDKAKMNLSWHSWVSSEAHTLLVALAKIHELEFFFSLSQIWLRGKRFMKNKEVNRYIEKNRITLAKFKQIFLSQTNLL